MKQSDVFFARKEQSAFIKKVYELAPPAVCEFFAHEERLLNGALSDCARVLEIGCGNGRALHAVPQQAQYTGIDIGFPYILDARREYPDHNWVCADACRLPFAAAMFNAVFCIQNTLGNMPGIEADVLRESFRVCGPSGKVILGVYSEDSFEIRKQWYDRLIAAGIFARVWLDPNFPRIARSDTGWSSRCFDQNELTQLFERNGAHPGVIRVDGFSYFCIAEIHRNAASTNPT